MLFRPGYDYTNRHQTHNQNIGTGKITFCVWCSSSDQVTTFSFLQCWVNVNNTYIIKDGKPTWKPGGESVSFHSSLHFWCLKDHLHGVCSQGGRWWKRSVSFTQTSLILFQSLQNPHTHNYSNHQFWFSHWDFLQFKEWIWFDTACLLSVSEQSEEIQINPCCLRVDFSFLLMPGRVMKMQWTSITPQRIRMVPKKCVHFLLKIWLLSLDTRPMLPFQHSGIGPKLDWVRGCLR